MKRLKPVNIHIDSCMDADDYGHRLTDCIEQMSENTNVVNLVKVRLGHNITAEQFHHIMKNVTKNLNKMGAKNCVYVALQEGFVEDITIDYIEVIDDELDKESD